MSTSVMKASEGNKIINNVMMTVSLVSFAMLFMTLLMGFFIYRLTAPVWPPQGMVRPSLLLPTISTLCIFISSCSYVWFEKDLIKNKLGLTLTIVFGFLFMFTQSMFWNHLHSMGIYASTGIFASIIYAFTWIHAAHIVLALIVLLWLAFTFNKMNGEKLELRASNTGKFWHFLGIIWLIMFVTIFVF